MLINAYIKKKRTQINNLMLFLKELKKQTNKLSSKIADNNLQSKLNRIETREAIGKKHTIKQRVGFLEKLKKLTKC